MPPLPWYEYWREKITRFFCDKHWNYLELSKLREIFLFSPLSSHCRPRCCPSSRRRHRTHRGSSLFSQLKRWGIIKTLIFLYPTCRRIEKSAQYEFCKQNSLLIEPNEKRSLKRDIVTRLRLFHKSHEIGRLVCEYSSDLAEIYVAKVLQQWHRGDNCVTESY